MRKRCTFQDMKILEMAQIRSGTLPLRIETGRYYNDKDDSTKKMRKMKVEERTCQNL